MDVAMRLTRAGKLALAQALTGSELKFTKVGIGSGEFDYSTESVFELTALRRWEMDLPLTATEVRGDGTVYLEAYLTNAEVYHGFAAREHGLYAIDPQSGAEILYAYKNVGEEYDFIPSNTGSAQKNLYVEYVCEISDAENVTAALDMSVAYLTRDDFEAHVESAHPHPNVPNQYLDVTAVDGLWGTDNDNHLHRIRLEDLKRQLKDEPVEPVSGIERAMLAKAELGLDANVLLVEDFSGESVLDEFGVKVTSSAENGRLLGVESVAGLKVGEYTITDGISAELVYLDSIVYNISGYHVRLREPLANSYDWATTSLFRSFSAGGERRAISWAPTGFSGVSANIARTLTLELDARDISGDGFLTADGEFAL